MFNKKLRAEELAEEYREKYLAEVQKRTEAERRVNDLGTRIGSLYYRLPAEVRDRYPFDLPGADFGAGRLERAVERLLKARTEKVVRTWRVYLKGRAGTKEIRGRLSLKATSGITFLDDCGEVVACFRSEQVVGYEAVDAQPT